MEILIYIAISILAGILSAYIFFRFRINRYKKENPLQGRYGLIKNHLGTFEVKEISRTSSGMVKLFCDNIRPNRKYPKSTITFDTFDNVSVVYNSQPQSVDPPKSNSNRYIIWIEETKVDWFDNNAAISRERKFNKL